MTETFDTQFDLYFAGGKKLKEFFETLDEKENPQDEKDFLMTKIESHLIKRNVHYTENLKYFFTQISKRTKQKVLSSNDFEIFEIAFKEENFLSLFVLFSHISEENKQLLLKSERYILEVVKKCCSYNVSEEISELILLNLDEDIFIELLSERKNGQSPLFGKNLIKFVFKHCDNSTKDRIIAKSFNPSDSDNDPYGLSEYLKSLINKTNLNLKQLQELLILLNESQQEQIILYCTDNILPELSHDKQEQITSFFRSIRRRELESDDASQESENKLQISVSANFVKLEGKKFDPETDSDTDDLYAYAESVSLSWEEFLTNYDILNTSEREGLITEHLHNLVPLIFQTESRELLDFILRESTPEKLASTFLGNQENFDGVLFRELSLGKINTERYGNKWKPVNIPYFIELISFVRDESAKQLICINNFEAFKNSCTHKTTQLLEYFIGILSSEIEHLNHAISDNDFESLRKAATYKNKAAVEILFSYLDEEQKQYIRDNSQKFSIFRKILEYAEETLTQDLERTEIAEEPAISRILSHSNTVINITTLSNLSKELEKAIEENDRRKIRTIFNRIDLEEDAQEIKNLLLQENEVGAIYKAIEIDSPEILQFLLNQASPRTLDLILNWRHYTKDHSIYINHDLFSLATRNGNPACLEILFRHTSDYVKDKFILSKFYDEGFCACVEHNMHQHLEIILRNLPDHVKSIYIKRRKYKQYDIDLGSNYVVKTAAQNASPESFLILFNHCDEDLKQKIILGENVVIDGHDTYYSYSEETEENLEPFFYLDSIFRNDSPSLYDLEYDSNIEKKFNVLLHLFSEATNENKQKFLRHKNGKFLKIAVLYQNAQLVKEFIDNANPETKEIIFQAKDTYHKNILALSLHQTENIDNIEVFKILVSSIGKESLYELLSQDDNSVIERITEHPLSIECIEYLLENLDEEKIKELFKINNLISVLYELDSHANSLQDAINQYKKLINIITILNYKDQFIREFRFSWSYLFDLDGLTFELLDEILSILTPEEREIIFSNHEEISSMPIKRNNIRVVGVILGYCTPNCRNQYVREFKWSSLIRFDELTTDLLDEILSIFTPEEKDIILSNNKDIILKEIKRNNVNIVRNLLNHCNPDLRKDLINFDSLDAAAKHDSLGMFATLFSTLSDQDQKEYLSSNLHNLLEQAIFNENDELLSFIKTHVTPQEIEAAIIDGELIEAELLIKAIQTRNIRATREILQLVSPESVQRILKSNKFQLFEDAILYDENTELLDVLLEKADDDLIEGAIINNDFKLLKLAATYQRAAAIQKLFPCLSEENRQIITSYIEELETLARDNPNIVEQFTDSSLRVGLRRPDLTTIKIAAIYRHTKNFREEYLGVKMTSEFPNVELEITKHGERYKAFKSIIELNQRDLEATPPQQGHIIIGEDGEEMLSALSASEEHKAEAEAALTAATDTDEADEASLVVVGSRSSASTSSEQAGFSLSSEGHTLVTALVSDLQTRGIAISDARILSQQYVDIINGQLELVTNHEQEIRALETKIAIMESELGEVEDSVEIEKLRQRKNELETINQDSRLKKYYEIALFLLKRTVADIYMQDLARYDDRYKNKLIEMVSHIPVTGRIVSFLITDILTRIITHRNDSARSNYLNHLNIDDRTDIMLASVARKLTLIVADELRSDETAISREKWSQKLGGLIEKYKRRIQGVDVPETVLRNKLVRASVEAVLDVAGIITRMMDRPHDESNRPKDLDEENLIKLLVEYGLQAREEYKLKPQKKSHRSALAAAVGAELSATIRGRRDELDEHSHQAVGSSNGRIPDRKQPAYPEARPQAVLSARDVGSKELERHQRYIDFLSSIRMHIGRESILGFEDEFNPSEYFTKLLNYYFIDAFAKIKALHSNLHESFPDAVPDGLFLLQSNDLREIALDLNKIARYINGIMIQGLENFAAISQAIIEKTATLHDQYNNSLEHITKDDIEKLAKTMVRRTLDFISKSEEDLRETDLNSMIRKGSDYSGQHIILETKDPEPHTESQWEANELLDTIGIKDESYKYLPKNGANHDGNKYGCKFGTREEAQELDFRVASSRRAKTAAERLLRGDDYAVRAAASQR